jgi:hypothetical protein
MVRSDGKAGNRVYKITGDYAMPASGFRFWSQFAIAALLTGTAIALVVTGSWPGGFVVAFVALGWVVRAVSMYRRWKHGDPLFPKV